jgi:fucose permease
LNLVIQQTVVLSALLSRPTLLLLQSSPSVVLSLTKMDPAQEPNSAMAAQPELEQPRVPAAEALLEHEFKPGRNFWLAFAPIAVLAMMASLDGTSVSVALPIIAKELNGSTIEAFWTGTSFLLTSAVFQLPIGALSEIFGRVYTLSACIVFFLVGIIVASVAQDFTTMLVGRTLQGVGGGGLILLNDIVITDLVPMRQRGAYFGMIGGVWAFGSVTGPVIGGALAYKASWVTSHPPTTGM